MDIYPHNLIENTNFICDEYFINFYQFYASVGCLTKFIILTCLDVIAFSN